MTERVFVVNVAAFTSTRINQVQMVTLGVEVPIPIKAVPPVINYARRIAQTLFFALVLGVFGPMRILLAEGGGNVLTIG
jgi:hypothetical protein